MEKLIKIVDTSIDVAFLENWTADPTCGAVVSFLGKVRNKNHGKEVLELEYTTYTAMALKQLDEIVGEVNKKWSIKKTALVHRCGNLKIGDTAVAIFISSKHPHYSFLNFYVDTIHTKYPHS